MRVHVLVNIEGRSGKPIDRNTYDVSDHFLDDTLPHNTDRWWEKYDYALYCTTHDLLSRTTH